MVYYLEDDDNIRELVVYTLTQTGFEARGFSDPDLFWAACAEQPPELVLLDIMLPKRDGLELLASLRGSAALRQVPVMMVTARTSEIDRVTGLDLGADDYLIKPFGMMELVARVRALLRRTAAARDDRFTGCGIELDTARHEVVSGGQVVPLTLKEFELLRLFMENSGRVLTRELLLETIWGYGYDGGTRTVDVHINTLRGKLGEAGGAIETVRGLGYRFGGDVKA